MLKTENRTNLPHDSEAEKSVLGSILFSADAYDEVVGIVKPECFYLDANRRLYRCLQSMYEKGCRAIDVVLLTNELKKRGDFDEMGGITYLVSVMESVEHAVHAVYYAQIVKEKFIRRELLTACAQITDDCWKEAGDVGDIAVSAEKRILDVLGGLENVEQKSFEDILNETFQCIFERMNRDDTEVHSTGFAGIDEKTTGFQPGELIVLAARPSMGKTAFICNLILAVIKTQAALVFSLEQSRQEISERLLCIHSRVNGHKLRKGELDEVAQQNLMNSAEILKSAPLIIDDTPTRTPSMIAAITRRVARTHHLGLVVVDYLQLVEPDDRKVPRDQQIAAITRKAKIIAKESQVPVVVLAQLNRGVEQREDKRPKLSDLRESGAIEQDADVVMFLYRPEVYDPLERPKEVDVIISKNRSGPLGTVTMYWEKENMRFSEQRDVLPFE
ncbi:replicative DNA helicase [Planctomicrobium sp. SH668]|uniref:replicative DNA helicase n=1 Tax=Planctomicrobium sp. SH668 TaxID=3448126 RepID=UPI003F5B02F9